MAGHTYRRRHAWSTARLLLSLLIIHPLSCFAENTILIIKSDSNKFFHTTIEQLIDRTGVEAKYTIRTLESLKQNATSDLDAQLIITLGQDAAEYAHTLNVTSPVIHSYVTQFQHKEHPSNHNHSSVLLEQPLERYAQFIKYLLPVKNVGILKTSEEQIPNDKLQKIQQKYLLNMNQSIFHEGDNPVSAVRLLLDKNDVLLTLPAPEIYNRKSLKGILLTSYRMNRPVISYSPSHVKSGALAAIYTTPANIGHQLAGLVTQFLKQDSFDLKPYYFASDFNISINERVAESLHLHLPDRESILKLLHKDSVR